MYMSRIIIPMKQADEIGLNDIYNCHKFVWTAFDGTKRDHLFRSESDMFTGNISILIVSKSKPNCPESVNEINWGCKEIPKDFFKHKKYRFALRANPNIRGSSDHKRRAIIDNDGIIEWITRQGATHGFNLLSVVIENKAPVQFQRHDGKGLVGSVDFTGALEVTDKKAFINAYEKGIGSAKAFGFGMLQLVPIH